MHLCMVPNNIIGSAAKFCGSDVYLNRGIDRRDPSLGARFSSMRSFNHRDPFRDAGEEFVYGSEIFLFKIWKVSQDLVLGHSGCEIRSEIVDRKARASNARLAPILPGSTVIRSSRLAITVTILPRKQMFYNIVSCLQRCSQLSVATFRLAQVLR